MDATQVKLFLASWGASDPALGDVEGDAYPLRLAGAGPVPVEVDQDPDVPARLVVRADLSAEGAGDTIDRILEDDHVKGLDLVTTFQRETRETRVVGSPLRFSGTRRRSATPPPEIGEHTESVLGELLGLGRDEVAQLREDGVV